MPISPAEAGIKIGLEATGPVNGQQNGGERVSPRAEQPVPAITEGATAIRTRREPTFHELMQRALATPGAERVATNVDAAAASGLRPVRSREATPLRTGARPGVTRRG